MIMQRYISQRQKLKRNGVPSYDLIRIEKPDQSIKCNIKKDDGDWKKSTIINQTKNLCLQQNIE